MSYHSSAGHLALCHAVNPALVIALRSKRGEMRPEVATFWTKTLNLTRAVHLSWLKKLN